MSQESRLAIVIDSNQAKVDVDKLNAALKELEAQGVRVVGISDKTSKGLGDVDKSAKAASSSLAEMATALGSVVSVATLWGRIQQTTMDASRYEQLGLIMEVVGRNAGYAAHELTDLQAELQKTGISMTQSRQVITQMVQAQMDLSHATQLARLAQDAATIGNISSSEALQRLVYGVQTAQTEILRNIGVVVNFEAAYKKLADELGKATTALTENEKMAARVNAVMEQGPAIAGAYEASMQNAGKQLGSMTRLLDDLSASMGRAYQPAFSAAIEGMSAAIKEAQQYAGPLSIGLAGITTAATAATTGVLALRGGVVALNVALNAMRSHPVIMTLSALAGVTAAVYVALSDTSRRASDTAASLREMQQPLSDVVARFKEMSLDAQQAKLVEYTEAQVAATKELDGAYKELLGSVQSINLLRFGIPRRELDSVVERLDAARASGEALSPILQDFAQRFGIPQSALNAWVTFAGNVDEAQGKLSNAGTVIDAIKDALEGLARSARGAGSAMNEGMADVVTKFLGDVQKQILALEAGNSALAKANQLIFQNTELTDAEREALLAGGRALDIYRELVEKANEAKRKGAQASRDYQSAIESLLDTHLPHVAALNELHKNLALLDKAQKAGIVTGQNYVKALESINLAYAKQVNDLLPESIKKAQEQVKAARDQQRQLQQQIRTFGMAESAVLALAAADTDSAIAKLEAAKANEIANGATTERIKHIEAEIQALRELRDLQLGSAGLQGQLEWREQQRQQWEAWARDVETIFDQVGQSLTDAIFEGGKSGRDLLKDLFKTLTFRVLIQPVMGQMQGWVTNQLGGLFGVQNPQQGGGMLGTAQNLYSGYNALNGGLNSTFGNAAQWLGQKIGSEALTSFGLGLSGTTAATGIASIGAGLGASLGASIGTSAAAMTSTTFAASMTGGALIPGLGVGAAGGGVGAGIGAAGAAGAAGTAGAASGGAAGIGAAVGSALPWIGGALAIGSALGLFDDGKPRTRHAQMSHADLQADGRFVVTTWDDRQSREVQEAAAAYATEAVKGATELFSKIGIDAAFTRFTTLMESSILGDRQGVGSSATIRIGDLEHEIGLKIEPSWTLGGYGGWSEAEMLPRLQTDIQLTLLEAFQVAGDQLPSVLSGMLEGVDIRSLGAEQAQALAQQFSLVVEQVSSLQEALGQLPFATLRDLTFDAAANLIQFAGGLEALDAGMTSYFENFYSEEEKLEWAAKQIGDAFGELGLTMPDVTQGAELAKAAYRDLVESLDVTTEEGQRAYATLMTLSGGFHELVTGMDQLSDATRRAHQGLLNSLMGDVNAALSAVQQRGQERIAKLSESFARTDAVFDAYRSQVQALESQWGSLISTMDRSMRDLRGRVDASARIQYDQARAVISTALLTGQMPQTADLGEAIRTAQQGVTGGRYASEFDQREAYLKLANELEALQGIAQPELDAARASLAQLEKQYSRLRGIEDLSGLSLKQLERQFAVALSAEEAARTQIAQIERQISMAQLQYQQLVGINQELSTLPAALNELAKAIESARAVQEAAGPNLGDRATRYLADNPDVLNAYLAGYGKGQTAEQFALEHYHKYGRAEGRSFDVGTPYVPYDMMANIHRGEIIIDPRSSDILRRYGIEVQGGGSRETEQLLREQLAEVRQQTRYLYEMVKSGKRTANNTEDLSMAVAHNPSDDVVVVF